MCITRHVCYFSEDYFKIQRSTYLEYHAVFFDFMPVVYMCIYIYVCVCVKERRGEDVKRQLSALFEKHKSQGPFITWVSTCAFYRMGHVACMYSIPLRWKLLGFFLLNDTEDRPPR